MTKRRKMKASSSNDNAHGLCQEITDGARSLLQEKKMSINI